MSKFFEFLNYFFSHFDEIIPVAADSAFGMIALFVLLITLLAIVIVWRIGRTQISLVLVLLVVCSTFGYFGYAILISIPAIANTDPEWVRENPALSLQITTQQITSRENGMELPSDVSDRLDRFMRDRE